MQCAVHGLIEDPQVPSITLEDIVFQNREIREHESIQQNRDQDKQHIKVDSGNS